MCYLEVGIGHRIPIVNGHTLSAGILIPSRQTNDYSLMLQWFIHYEMRCRQYQNTITSRDMQSHIRDKSTTNNRYIGAQSTECTYRNQPLVRPHFPGLGKWDLGFICPEWRRILSVQYMANQLSGRILNIWLQ